MTRPSKGREAAHRRAAAIAAREQQRRQQARTRAIVVGIVVAVVVLATVIVAVAGGGDDDDADIATDDAPTSTSTSVDDGEDPYAESVPIEDAEERAEGFQFGTGECAPERKPDEPVRTFADAFRDCLKPDAEYKAVVGTSEGSFTIDLLPKRAPGAVNNFVQLARWGYFDGLTFHRIVPGFVIQGGDPKGDGTGGPGYQFGDELPTAVSSYTPGAVAMANSGPGTNGSQWFVCIDCVNQLPTPGYSLFGWVSDGWDVVRAINAKQNGSVTIVAVEILEDPLKIE